MNTPLPGDDMRRDFADRDELIAYLREQFPDAAAVDEHTTDVRGGRAAADAQLNQAQMGRVYKTSRNDLDGAVTRLSPYLRHGVLALAEVRDAALASAANSKDAEKFINELGWRDYYQRVYAEIGDGVWEDRELSKTGLAPDDYATDLPDDIRDGTTGLACIDDFSRELAESGYLHNHARMWTAAYVVHWRRVRWQAGRGVVSGASAGRRPGQQQPVVAMGGQYLQPQAVHLQPGEPGAVLRRSVLSRLPAGPRRLPIRRQLR